MVRNMDSQKYGWLEICIVRKMNGQIYMDGRNMDGTNMDGRIVDGRNMDGRNMDGRNMDGKKYGQVEIWMPRNIDG